MNEKFYKYLLNKGFNETGAKELISRVERGAEDRHDMDIIHRYKDELRKEQKNE